MKKLLKKLLRPLIRAIKQKLLTTFKQKACKSIEYPSGEKNKLYIVFNFGLTEV